jgi:hydrogenase maturation factor
MGKLAAKDLKKLLNCIKQDSRVVVPPKVGFDAGVHRLEDKYLAVATDPCTGVPEEWFGYLLINYAASDVSLFGAKPEFCTITLMGPRPTAPEKFQQIMKQTCSAADELGIAIVRGHTGMYDSLSELVGVCTVYGTVTPENLITPANAKPDDLILCTKPVGQETAVNYALTYKKHAQEIFGTEQTQKLAKLVPAQSCTKEALHLAQTGAVHAMHDATEGGLIAALNELAEASSVGFEVHWEKIPICPQMQTLQNNFGLSDEQVLASSSTGTILAAVDPKAKEKTEQTLTREGLQACFIGKFTKQQKCLLIRNKKTAPFPSAAEDPYTKLMLSGKR